MRFFVMLSLCACAFLDSRSQPDTTYIFNRSGAFGPLDIRIAKSSNEHYYLEEGATFSFREHNGIKTNAYLDMTAWDSEAYLQGNMRLTNPGGSNKFVMNFRYLMPPDYDEDYQPGYPLVIVLHGLHESANCARAKCYHGTVAYDPNVNTPEAPSDQSYPLLNNDYNLIHGGLNYLEAHRMTGSSFPNDPALPANAFPGFVVFPQNLNGWDVAAAEDAIRLVRLFSRKYNVDENRIYINGISNGGRGAYEVLKRAPWMFAAAVLFSAADDASIIAQKAESRIVGLPLWIFQGEIDELPTQKQTEGYIRKFRDAGAVIRYTLYEQIGHGTWNKGFSEPDFFGWMLRQKKNNLHVFAGNPAICSTTGEGASLAMPAGYRQYEWKFNDEILSAESKPAYTAYMPGEYRGRFRRSSDENSKWNEWSEPVTVVEKKPPPAEVKQSGTVVLRDPNKGNEVNLEALGLHAYYRWFRNGIAIDLPGDADDTFKIVKLNANLGDAVYTVKVYDYDQCVSPASAGKHVFFNDRAPINIATPEEVLVSAISPSRVSVTWKDVSDNEDGFEVWRRVVSTSGESPWIMSTLANANATTYEDTHLSPASLYEYKIRGVSNTGRSEYGAAMAIMTDADNTAPSAPIGLTASVKGAQEISLGWHPSQDNSSIKEYVIYTPFDTIHTGSLDTIFVLKEFQVNTDYAFNVRSVDVANNVSRASNDARLFTRIKGLFYEHSTGEWSSLKEINWNIAEFTGVIDSFSLAPKTQEDFFNFRFDGFLTIEKGGVYQFRLSSNDGSRLLLDDSVFILNDGIHNVVTVTAPVHVFPEGPHRISVEYFDNILADTLNVEYKGPDTKSEWISIPSHRLTSGELPGEQHRTSENLSFEIYPNPLSHNQLKLVFSTTSTQPIKVRLLSSTGQQLRELEILSNEELSDETAIATMELPDLNNGTYFIKAEQASRFKIRRLVILK